jgi:uncharacterized repeat protein (TIGR01451 family)
VTRSRRSIGLVLVLVLAGLVGSAVPAHAQELSATITKSDSPDPVTTGGTLTYTVVLTNTSDVDADAYAINDSLPDGVTFVSATATVGSCAEVDPGLVDCHGFPVPAGESVTVTIVVTAPTTAGTITNEAVGVFCYFECTQSSPLVTATEDTTVVLPPGACTIVGTNGNDVLNGTSGPDKICARNGNDLVRGFGGNDILLGQGGDDNVQGGPGNDRLDGGTGNDMLNAGPGNDTNLGGDGNDTLNSVDGVQGNDANDGGAGVDMCLVILQIDLLDMHNNCLVSVPGAV